MLNETGVVDQKTTDQIQESIQQRPLKRIELRLIHPNKGCLVKFVDMEGEGNVNVNNNNNTILIELWDIN